MNILHELYDSLPTVKRSEPTFAIALSRAADFLCTEPDEIDIRGKETGQGFEFVAWVVGTDNYAAHRFYMTDEDYKSLIAINAIKDSEWRAA